MANNKIKLDEETHKEIVDALKKIKDKFEDADTKIQTLVDDVNSNFKGEAASSLSDALAKLKGETTEKKTGWENVITSAENVAQSIRNADKEAKNTVEK